MSLEYALERLYETGWTPGGAPGLEQLPDGRCYPAVLTIQREFARAGLELAIKHNLVFGCYRAEWHPIGQPLDPAYAADQQHGTVVGACQCEAAVYALAQLRAGQHQRQLASV